MARARNVKPSFFKNEILGVEDPLISLLFISLWTLADREGKLEDRPLRIKAETFPYRESLDINGYLTVLEQSGFIVRYKSGSECFIKIVNFEKHQSPHKTEKESDIPNPPLKSDSCPITVIAPLNNGELTDAAALNPERGIMNHERGKRNPERGIMNHESDKIKPTPLAAVKKSEEKILGNKKPNFNLENLPPGITEKIAVDYINYRKAIKKPIATERAFISLMNKFSQAHEAGYTVDEALSVAMERNWQGFEVAWLDKKINKNFDVGEIPDFARDDYGDNFDCIEGEVANS